MAWFYNSYSGELTSASGFDALAYEAAIHTGTGWHQLKISASATEAQAAAEARKEDPKGTAPTTSISTGIGNAVVHNPLTNAVGNALGLPTFSNTRDFVSRAVRVIIGAMLIIVGVSSLLKDQGISVPKAVPV
jgi:hypothetical protein